MSDEDKIIQMGPTCPMRKTRSDLPPMIPRIEDLPIDDRGYPVPFFVQWVHKDGEKITPAVKGAGEPDFRIVDPAALKECITENRCWVCGGKLGTYRAYVVGPMCVINRNSAEPPSHIDCAEWSLKACPFLSRPNMVRREDEMTKEMEGNVAGIMIKRNPGVSVLWVVKNGLNIWKDPNGRPLFDIGEPVSVKWWKEGRPATGDECVESIDSGLQALLDVCEDGHERNEVLRRRDALVATLRRVGNRDAT